MADDETEVDAEAQSFIDEMLEAGFRYERNGMVAGFATPETDPEDDPDELEETADGLSDAEVPEPGDEGSTPEGGEPSGVGDAGADRGAHTGKLELRGQALTETEADGLLHLRKLLIEHPEFATEVNRLAEERLGRPTPTTPPPAVVDETPVDKPSELPEHIDPDDETAVFLYRELEAARAEAARANQVATGTVEQVQTEAHNRQIAADTNAAIARFRDSHPDLDDQDIASIRLHTATTVNIPGVMANFPGDPVEGLTRAMEIGSMTDPAVRDKVLGTPTRDVAAEKEATRKRSLSALSGGGGATRRRAPKEPKPAGWADVSKKLAEEIANLPGGNN